MIQPVVKWNYQYEQQKERHDKHKLHPVPHRSVE